MQLLVLSYLPTLGSLTLQRILIASPLLQHLSVERSFNAATDDTMKVLASHCPHIRTLSLAYCALISDHGLRNLIVANNDDDFPKERRQKKTSNLLESLQELSLAHCYELTSTAMSELVRRMVNLMVLSLECKGIGRCVAHATRAKLICSAMAGCFQVTDDLLYALGSTPNKLTGIGTLC
jgi:hypothetical protein